MAMKKNNLPKCPVCLYLSNINRVEANGFTYLQCQRCKLVYQAHPPSNAFLNHYYAYENSKPGNLKILNPLLFKIAASPFLWSIITLWTDYIIHSRASTVDRIKSSPGTIFDVGCGPGDFLAAMEQKKWSVSGNEVGKKLVSIASDKVSTGKIYLGDLSSIKTGSKKFDVITFWHVWEHISFAELNKTTKTVDRMLNDQGRLIIEVPHANSLAFKLFGPSWTLLLSPQHLHLWTRDSLNKFLKSRGFKAIRTEYPVHFPFVFLSSCIKKYPWSKWLLPIVLPVSVIFEICASKLGQGEVIRIYAQKT